MSAVSKVASVISTGGAGVTFEQHVGASFLTLLLTQSFLPVHKDTVATEVHFQARRLGWNVDDLLVVGVGVGGPAKLCVQIKRAFVLSSKDEECRKTFAAAWADFNDANLFDRRRDALVLATHLGTNRLLGDFGWLLAQARASASSADFSTRRLGAGLLGQKSKGDYDTVAEIVSAEAGSPVPDGEIWAFLRAFHVVSFDLLGSSAKDEASMLSLLNFMRTDDSPIDAASTTWNELVVLAGTAASVGESFQRSGLPADVLRRHRNLVASGHGALTRLRQHSEVVLRRIEDSSGNGFGLPRAALRTQLETASTERQVVLIVGAAGSGKSVLAKQHFRSRDESEASFAFAAEEFKVTHIDQVLTQAQIGLNWQALKSMFPVQPKLFLIEGLERLLESDDRAAFIDLLKAAVDDPSIRLVITCRDYHAEMVERSMLRPSGVDFARIVVAGLDDTEIEQAREAFPQLRPLLANPAIRDLLRNPFMLSRATNLAWSDGRDLPQTERALRECMWNEVVRRETFIRDNLPTRRAAALTSIALDRARSLQPYVQVGTDTLAIEALASDNLVVYDSITHARCAPAHDVFEDWALLNWLSVEFAIREEDAVSFVEAIGAYPALRRAYRKWLFEMLESEPARAVPYVASVAGVISVPEFFRDDTLVSVFQSSKSAVFLERFSSKLFEDDAALAKRVIHLVRVACKTVSPEVPKGAGDGFHWHVPSGRAWPTFLSFLVSKWTALPPSIHGLLIEFLEDWAQGISAIVPYPEGSEAAGSLLARLFAVSQDSYGERSAKQRLVSLLVRMPKASSTLFKELVERAKISSDRRSDNRDGELLITALLKPFQSNATCRDFPADLEDICLSVWRLREETDSETDYASLHEMDREFGLEHSYEHRMFPASALQGPFYFLLRSHPVRGLRFITNLVNEATDNFGRPRSADGFFPALEKASLRLANGTTREVWCDARLWNGYRALSVMPDVLECALMALEKWLLDISRLNNPQWDEVVRDALDWLLENSNNVALAAVVASVCMAHPDKFFLAALSMLGCRDFFELDRARMVQESGALAPGGFDAYSQAFQKERMESNGLPHRARDLERLAIDLQTTGKGSEVGAVLDRYRAELPDPSLQDDGDRLWRLALDRMDLRTWEVKEVDAQGRTFFGMSKLADDIQEVIDRAVPGQERFHSFLSLYMWARNQFDRQRDHAATASEWQIRLASAKTLRAQMLSSGEEVSVGSGGPNTTAAVCIRDHWAELPEADRQWCVEVVTELVGQPLSGDHSNELHAKNPLSGVADCAYVLPFLASLDEANSELRASLIAGLCHFNDDVRTACFRGISHYVIGAHPELERLAIAALFANARQWNTIQIRNSAARFDQRPSRTASLAESLAAAQASAAGQDRLDIASELGSLSLETWPDRALAKSLMEIYRSHPQEPAAIALFVGIAGAMKTWWAPTPRGERRQERSNIELEQEAEQALAEFVLASPTSQANRLIAPIVESVDVAPEAVSKFMLRLLVREDGDAGPSTYWQLWAALTSAMRTAPWLEDVDDRRAQGQEMMRQSFFGIDWRAGLRSWSRLGDRFSDVDRLFVALPRSGFVLECYAHYLYHIGAASLPGAFVLIADKFGDRLGPAINKDGNLRFHLDALVSRCLFEELSTIRKNSSLRAATMAILDGLVQAGSSLAFQLRDDFVTPSAVVR